MESVQLRNAPGLVVERRAIPITHLNITATTSGTAQTLFEVRSGATLEVRRLVVTNTTGTAATITLHTIPSGGTIGVGNAELVGTNVPANSPADMTDFIGGLYEQGTVFKVYSDTNGALTIHGWGSEIL